jgi:uncharacterized protein YydD (DUF2326 family)
MMQEVKTRFTSTLTIFHSVMSYDQNKSIEEINKKVELNIAAVNEALDNVGTKKAKKLKIKKSEIGVIINTSLVLEPICEMLTTLGGVNYVSGSVVLPYTKKVVSLLKVEETDPKNIVDLKMFIRTDWLDRCRVNLNFDLLQKQLSWIHDLSP